MPVFDPDRPTMAGLPGYKRGSWGSKVQTLCKSAPKVLVPEVEAERYLAVARGDFSSAIAALERDAGDQRFTHHCLRLAANLLRARWVEEGLTT